MKTGRKSLKEELQIKQRYADLSEPYFKVLKKALESKNPADQRWAVEQLTKAYTKMIPQQVTGEDDGPIQIKVINYADGNYGTVQVHAEGVPASVT